MKCTKRMFVAMMAAVLLMAGGLSYFAVAADAEPYSLTHPCQVEGCDSITHEVLLEVYDLWDSHSDGNRECHYDIGHMFIMLNVAMGIQMDK